VNTGLDEFSSELNPPARADAPTPQPRRGARVAIGILVAAVLLEAVPAALWLQEHFRLPGAAADNAGGPALASLAPPPIAIAVPPCEVTPLSDPSARVAPATAGGTRAETATTAAASARGMLAGVIAVTAPVAMRVYEHGRFVGTTEAERMMLPAGTHDLEFVNDSVGYRSRRVVTVRAGVTSPIQLEPPMGTLHVNAVPWAEVWIDDKRVGETPIGNLQTRIGSRQVVFRHPELGERRATVLVTLIGPARISMDLRAK
jgi:hypothetical protein